MRWARAGREQQPDSTANNQQVGVRDHHVDLLFKLGGMPDVVVIARRDKCSGGNFDRGVACPGEAWRMCVRQDSDRVPLRAKYGQGRVHFFPVVDHGALDPSQVGLAHDGLDRLPHELGSSARCQDD